IKMHVTMNGDPEKDTISKLKTLGKLHGQILDTCMGLGYTAIAAARQPDVQGVTVCEADANMFALCRENPWSAGLFENPAIHPVLKPVQEHVPDIPDESVNAVIHDPPRFALAPALYSEQFYRQLFRILTAKGRMYHYTGDPNRRTRRSSLPQKTMSLLKKVGFRKVREAYFGVIAFT
ncbi:MAG: methyltransferase, partial [Calditrichia bacterium]